MLPLLVGGAYLSGLGTEYAIPLYAALSLFNFAFAPATELSKDRQDGTLEFICSLPVRGRDLALARTCAVVEACVLVGLFSAASVLIFLPTAMGPRPVAVAAASAFLGSAVLTLAAATALMWLSLRFRPEYIVPALLAGTFGVAILLGHLGVSIRGIWRTLPAFEATLTSVFAGIAVLAALVALASLHLLGRAMDRCVRDPAHARMRPR